MYVIMFVGIFVAILAAAVAGGLAVRRSQREAVPQWAEWARTVKTLRWRDRFEVYLATTRGRAVSRRELAEFALQRCRAAVSLIERQNAGLGSRWRLGVMVLFFAVGGLTIVRAVFEPHLPSLGHAVMYLTFGYLLTPAMQAKLNERWLARLRQAAEANANAHA